MRRLLAFSLAQPLAVLAATVAFALAGAVAFWHLPIVVSATLLTVLVLPVLYTYFIPERWARQVPRMVGHALQPPAAEVA